MNDNGSSNDRKTDDENEHNKNKNKTDYSYSKEDTQALFDSVGNQKEDADAGDKSREDINDIHGQQDKDICTPQENLISTQRVSDMDEDSDLEIIYLKRIR